MSDEEIRALDVVLDHPDAFRSLVDRLPDGTTKIGLQLWGAIRGYYPRVPLPIPAEGLLQERIFAHPASDR